VRSRAKRPKRGRATALAVPGRPRADDDREFGRAPRPHRDASEAGDFADRTPRPPRRQRPDDADLEVFRIEVGRAHGVEPRNILGAIANEAGIDAKHIGRIELFDDYSTVELPSGMPKPVFEHLKRVWVSGQQLRISRAGQIPAAGTRRPPPRDVAPGETRADKPRPARRPSGAAPGSERPPGKPFKAARPAPTGRPAEQPKAGKPKTGKFDKPRKPKA
jgi:ATP-dependent RNA helicase DeaD